MDRPTCERCTNLWQWGGLCPECISADDQVTARGLKQPRSGVIRTRGVARGLHDHERVARAPRKQPTVN